MEIVGCQQVLLLEALDAVDGKPGLSNNPGSTVKTFNGFEEPTCKFLEVIGRQQVLLLEALDQGHSVFALALRINQGRRALVQPLGNGVELAVGLCQLIAQRLNLRKAKKMVGEFDSSYIAIGR